MMSDTMQPKKYKCVFFDLDHTLWDYETNARETLDTLYHEYGLSSKGVDNCEGLYRQFRKINLQLWDQYDRGMITNDVIKRDRFRMVLAHFGIDDEKLNQNIAQDYFHNCPKRGNLIPYAVEVLEYLADHYHLTIITNGFEEIQSMKLNAGKIHHFFDHVITSQKAGHRKPSREIFDYAMKVNGIQCCDAVMIGDNLLTDITGAKNSTIDTIFFNPDNVRHDTIVNHEIACLSELRKIL